VSAEELCVKDVSLLIATVAVIDYACFVKKNVTNVTNGCAGNVMSFVEIVNEDFVQIVLMMIDLDIQKSVVNVVTFNNAI